MHVPSHARDAAVLSTASAYYELVTEGASARDAIELAASASLVLDAPRLGALCRAVGDPFAWQPFLRRLYTIPPTSRTVRTEHSLVVRFSC